MNSILTLSKLVLIKCKMRRNEIMKKKYIVKPEEKIVIAMIDKEKYVNGIL